MHTVYATIPCLEVPEWAIWERCLLDVMSRSVHPFLEKYTTIDGELVWKDVWPEAERGRDGVDDFYEAFGNWPLLYLLGGADELLALSQRQWDATTRLLTRLGPVHKEFERGYDQFHQSEYLTFFYFLCLADPHNPLNIDRARRFAGLYLNEDPQAQNYDIAHRLVRAPHTGSGGPRWGYNDNPTYAYNNVDNMRRYGLPLEGLPGITSYDDLADPAKARQMGAAMQQRMGSGDVAQNLLVTSLVANAYLLTGDAKYQHWLTEYVDAWIERARANGGLLPDNVGPNGVVGELFDGRWFGGLYGWTWPHGYHNIGVAACVAAANAMLLTGDPRYLDLARAQMDELLARAELRPVREVRETSLAQMWIGHCAEADDETPISCIPYRIGLDGWFDFQPLSANHPALVWFLSQNAADWARLERMRAADWFDWRRVLLFRTKEDGGHEHPWLRFVRGENPAYPEAILRASYGQVLHRMALIRADSADPTQVHIHHWQDHNPVTTEALVQLTLGAPQHLYNGGLLHCSVRYFDAARNRPGLPHDVAALVDRVHEAGVRVHLVNLSPFEQRELIVQGGGFGEHRFEEVRYERRTSNYPSYTAAPDEYGWTNAPPPVRTAAHSEVLGERYLLVVLPPATRITLELAMARHVYAPSYATPWEPA